LGTSVAISCTGWARIPAAPDRSDRSNPVAEITACQCRDGMARAWRHFRTASVLTPVSRAAASAPPSRSITSSTLTVMTRYLTE